MTKENGGEREPVHVVVLTAQINAKSEGIVFIVEKWKQISVIVHTVRKLHLCL